MRKSPLISNPFALMMEPQAVLQAIEDAQSQRHVKGRVYRPLDKPTDPAMHDDARKYGRRQGANTLDD